MAEVRLVRVNKHYGPVQALHDVSWTFRTAPSSFSSGRRDAASPRCCAR